MQERAKSIVAHTRAPKQSVRAPPPVRGPSGTALKQLTDTCFLFFSTDNTQTDTGGRGDAMKVCCVLLTPSPGMLAALQLSADMRPAGDFAAYAGSLAGGHAALQQHCAAGGRATAARGLHPLHRHLFDGGLHPSACVASRPLAHAALRAPRCLPLAQREEIRNGALHGQKTCSAGASRWLTRALPGLARFRSCPWGG